MASCVVNSFCMPVSIKHSGIIGVTFISASGPGIGEKESAGFFHDYAGMRFESRVAGDEMLDVGFCRAHHFAG